MPYRAGRTLWPEVNARGPATPSDTSELRPSDALPALISLLTQQVAQGKHKSFTRNQGPGQPPTTGVIVDGVAAECRAEGFAPRTLFVGCTNPAQPPDLTATVAAAGGLTYRVTGLHQGGPWIRTFDVQLGEQLQISIETFADVRVELLNVPATLVNVRATVIVTDQLASTDHNAPAFLALTYAAGGVYPVPPGATAALFSTDDPNFQWGAGGQVGAPVSVLVPAFTGVRQVVQGSYVTTSIPALSIVWEIAL